LIEYTLLLELGNWSTCWVDPLYNGNRCSWSSICLQCYHLLFAFHVLSTLVNE